jgi:uncharacterized membrane protein YphA (DoxX/SURF4 family)
MGSTALRPLGLAVIGPIATAIGVKETLLGAFVLTMLGSVTLFLIPDMWRITSDAAPEAEPHVVPDETLGAEIDASYAREM